MGGRVSTAVFGAFDGMTSVIGVIIGLLSASSTSIVRACVGLAVASACGMAAGEYLGDEGRNAGMAGVMAVATLAGTLAPIVPFLVLPKSAALPVAGALALVIAAGIATVRSRFESTLRSWIETFAILVIVTAVTVVVALGTGAVG